MNRDLVLESFINNKELLDKRNNEGIEKYRKGALGALPEPDLINSLIRINGNGEVPDDEE